MHLKHTSVHFDTSSLPFFTKQVDMNYADTKHASLFLHFKRVDL